MPFPNKKVILQVGNLLAPVVIFAVAALITIGLGIPSQFFGVNTNKSLIDPANFTFAIWGPIFVFLFIYLFYQARDLFKSSENKIEMPYVEDISVFFILSTVMTASWYVFWTFGNILLSTLSMILYLVFLLIGYLRLDINKKVRSRNEIIALTIPWSIHSAWITAATIISVKTFLISLGFNSPSLISNIILSIIVILVALGIYLAVLLTRDDYLFAGVGIWVILGILIERLMTVPIVLEIVVVAIAGIIILTLGITFKVLKARK